MNVRAARRNGISLIDLIMSMAIIAILFGGIYLVYFSLLSAVANIDVRTAAASAIQAELETIRNLPYSDVGTVGGAPAGTIQPSQIVSVGQYSFMLTTTVLDIDDPFDNNASSSASSTDADYKQVSVEATCPNCSNYVAVTITTTVAPAGLESNPTNEGALYLYAIDANGNPVSGASMQVTNSSITPSIALTDFTNASGVLELLGLPTSTNGYHIVATKPGYSTAQTYPPGGAANPNPLQPDATVIAQTVTPVTFAIDLLSTTTVLTSDDRCSPYANVPFSMQGAKLIGTSPNVYKFATTSETGAGGSIVMSNIEWDSYTFALSGSAYDLAGTIPLNPLVVQPATSDTMRMIVAPAADPSLLVSVLDAASGAGIQDASVTITNGGFSAAQTTDRAFIGQSDWSGGAYSSQSGGISAGASGLSLALNASGTYNTNTYDWLVSNTFDLGGSNAALYGLSWSPAAEPAGTSVKFQLAGNNDNATWNFIGPDGTVATYFTQPTSSLPASLNGDRYIRYKAVLNTTNPSSTPSVASTSIEFSADCVPTAQAFFTGLPQATYNIDVTAQNYAEATATVAVGAGESATAVYMNHL